MNENVTDVSRDASKPKYQAHEKLSEALYLLTGNVAWRKGKPRLIEGGGLNERIVKS